MPFHGVLSSRQHIFQPEPLSDIAVNDAAAWQLYPDYRHVYNKLDIAKSQGLSAHSCSESPTDCGFEPGELLFVKPIINLQGMSLNARQCLAADVPRDDTLFWSPLLKGRQTSTDCLLLDGRVVWFAHTLAADEKYKQRPVWWQVGVDLSDEEAAIRTFVELRLQGYTGVCNIERIGDVVIEMHLRGSNGFYDLYPADFVACWVRLVDEKLWVSPQPMQGGYVVSVFEPAPDDYASLYPEAGLNARVMEDGTTPDRVAIVYLSRAEG